MKRRTLLSSALSAGLPWIGAGASRAAEAWLPTKPVKIVMPYPAGGTSDVLARQIGEKLTAKWKQPIIVDNRPGGASVIAADATAKAPPDGYTYLWATAAITAINPLAIKDLPYNPIKDFEPVGEVAKVDEFLIVSSSLPVKTMAEFVAYAKAHPGAINYASFGNSSGPHLAMASLEIVAGIKLSHVPYKGVGPASLDLLSDRVQAIFTSTLALLGPIKEGKLRVLATGSPQRARTAPDVPTFQEAGIDLTMATWFGLLAPAGTPRNIVTQVSRDVAEIVRDPAFQAKNMEYYLPVGGSPQELNELIRSEQVTWADRVKQYGIKLG